MKVRSAKQMVLPALGVGAGMFASPKVSAAHPTLAKYPEIAPVILLIVAIALFGVQKARGFAIGLGAVALVFLVMTLYSRVTVGKAVAGETEKERAARLAEEKGMHPWLWEDREIWQI